MTREELQSEVKKAFSHSNNIAIQASTGAGKTKLALEILDEIKKAQITPIKVLIVVAEIAHIDTWNKEKDKWDLFTDSYTIICYASLKKYKNTYWDAIVFDEAHHLGSDLRLEIFDTLKSRYRIFLSATLKNSLLFRLSNSCGYIENVKLNLQDAIESNILPEPKIILIPMKLDNNIKNQVIVEEWGKSDKRITIKCEYKDRWVYKRDKQKYPNIKLEISCTQQQYYDYLSEQFEYYKRKYFSCKSVAVRTKWLQAGSKRKRLLGAFKTEEVKKILNLVKNKRFICFCSSIEQANYLGGDNAIHSAKKDSFNIIDKFNKGEISNLYAVGMLQEGVNLTDIEAGIIIQLDGEERAFIQKFGKLVLPVCI